MIVSKFPNLIRDRKFHMRTYTHCMLGNEMTDWFLQVGNGVVRTRAMAVSMWQLLLEEGIIKHGKYYTHKHFF